MLRYTYIVTNEVVLKCLNMLKAMYKIDQYLRVIT